MLKIAALLLGPLLFLSVTAAAAETGPPHHRIYPLEGGVARVAVPSGETEALWRVEDEAGRPVRDWAPADPDGAVRVPRGGWFRLLRRGVTAAVGEAPRAVGERFAAGFVILVTGQSQAHSFFWSGDPAVGAVPAGAGDPPLPPIAAWLGECAVGAPGCGEDGTAWSVPGDALGGRVLLAELARRLGPVPLALANGAWGGASAAELADPDTRAGRRLRRVARAAAPASAAVVLAHGTTDTVLGTPPERYRAALARIVDILRAGAEGPGAPPVLLAPLSPLLGGTRLLGSGSLASWVLPAEGAPRWMLRMGVASSISLPAQAEARAGAIRAAQFRAAAELGLLPGGDMASVMPGLDGVHWSPDGVREAARRVAAALADALPPP
jgi:lysophospholipase L1-like esterase